MIPEVRRDAPAIPRTVVAAILAVIYDFSKEI